YGGLFAGERTRIDDFKAWLTAHKGPGERLRDITEASPQIRNAVQRAGRFLSLASLVSVLLCAIAVAMAARAYVRRHLDTVALLKTLGATRSFTLTVSVLQLLALALAALALGAALGFLAQEWLLRTIRGLLAVTELPAPSLTPLAIGFVTAIAVLAGFALPPLLQLARVPALRVLRRDLGPPPLVVLLAFGPAVSVVLLLLSILRDDLNGDWQRTLPPNLPNYFFINIPPAVREDFVRFLAAQGARTTRVLPMIRGRLTAINARPVEALRPGHGGEESF